MIRRTALTLAAGLIFAASTPAIAVERPRPSPRPQKAIPAAPAGPALPAPDAPPPLVGLGPACLGRLRAAGHEVEPAAAPKTEIGAACLVAEPVRLKAVGRPGGAPIALPEAPLIACALAEPFAAWLSRIAAPALRVGLGSDLVRLDTGPGYACRARNRQAGAKISAHGTGRALDIAGFGLADGRTVPMTAMTVRRPSEPPAQVTSEPAATLDALRLAACGAFTTVLGPGADPFHGDHLHLDVEIRGRDGRSLLCQ